jgi:hypothetical protein
VNGIQKAALNAYMDLQYVQAMSLQCFLLDSHLYNTDVNTDRIMQSYIGNYLYHHISLAAVTVMNIDELK